jgi:hypothetical protein
MLQRLLERKICSTGSPHHPLKSGHEMLTGHEIRPEEAFHPSRIVVYKKMAKLETSTAAVRQITHGRSSYGVS